MVIKMNELFFLILLWMGMSVIVELASGNFEVLFTPSYFYSKGMNWFGAYFCTILLGILSPPMFVFKIFRWLCIVGR